MRMRGPVVSTTRIGCSTAGELVSLFKVPWCYLAGSRWLVLVAGLDPATRDRLLTTATGYNMPEPNAHPACCPRTTATAAADLTAGPIQSHRGVIEPSSLT